MLKLYSRVKPISKTQFTHRIVAKITDSFTVPAALRSHLIFMNKTGMTSLPDNFKAYLVFDNENSNVLETCYDNIFSIPMDFNYLQADDIIVIDPAKNSIKVVFRKNSPSNSILLTENCNNFCLMCSQPPRNINDRYLVDEVLSMIPLISQTTKEIGITGGEPTLLGNDLITILKKFKNHLPYTAIHVLTNGRNFVNTQLVEDIAKIEHQDLMFGIPLYSDIPSIHDYVVQANNAYNETLKGIINLKTLSQKVEIRVVLHKQTYKRLPELAEFIEVPPIVKTTISQKFRRL